MSENIIQHLKKYPTLKNFVQKKSQSIRSRYGSPSTNMVKGVFNTFSGNDVPSSPQKIINTLLEAVHGKNVNMIKSYIEDSGDAVQIISELKGAAFPPEENENIYVNIGKVTSGKEKFDNVINALAPKINTSAVNSNVEGGRRRKSKSRKTKSKKSRKTKKTRKH